MRRWRQLSCLSFCSGLSPVRLRSEASEGSESSRVRAEYEVVSTRRLLQDRVKYQASTHLVFPNICCKVNNHCYLVM